MAEKEYRLDIIEAFHAARASMHRVTDSRDLSVVRFPLDSFRAICKYVSFSDGLGPDDVRFESDSAHVVTKASGRQAYNVRRFVRSSGRNSFTVPSLRLSAENELSLLDDSVSESILQIVGKGVPKRLGSLLLELVENNLNLALAAAAEAQGNLILGSPDDLPEIVEDLQKEMSTESTVICHHHDQHRLLQFPRVLGLSDDANVVRATRSIPESVVLVVGHEPAKVGRVSINVEPQLFVSLVDVCVALATAAAEAGFFVWGNAPVTRIDLRQGNEGR